MKTVLELFNTESLNVLGYTLLHSLWEALLIAIIAVVTLRFIPTKSSNIRYAIASVSLFATIFFSVATYAYLQADSLNLTPVSTAINQGEYVLLTDYSTPALMSSYIAKTQALIQSWVPLFLAIWIAGTLLFSLRIFMGLAFVEKLRQGSTLLQNEWSEYIQQRTKELQIDRIISLAESASIQAPVVIGYLKPLILIPIGMCSSLSTEQLETIFLHELMHVRRKDYLINLVQAFVEAIYFFNPFVWILSEIIKREREHCCDDAVVRLHGNAAEYARALTMLEEARLSKTGLSLSLAENKNQLLKRIKRLMEKSVKNNYSRERIIPALLLVIGLTCASWVSTQTGSNDLYSIHADSRTVASDTTKKDKKVKNAKERTANTKQNSATNKPDKTNPDSEERAESDDYFGFPHGPAPFPHFDFDMPPPPDVAGMMPALPEFELMFKDFQGPHFELNENDWEEFSEEFEKNFKSKFGEFYEKNEKDTSCNGVFARQQAHIQKMMDEIQGRLNSRLDGDWEIRMNEMAAKQEEWARVHAEKWAQQAEKMYRDDGFIKNLSEDAKRQAEIFHKEFEIRHKEFEKIHKEFETKTRAFEEELKQELINDGYLKKDEKLENIHWHNGKLDINGERVNSEDEKKYNEIREKYFSEPKPAKEFE